MSYARCDIFVSMLRFWYGPLPGFTQITDNTGYMLFPGHVESPGVAYRKVTENHGVKPRDIETKSLYLLLPLPLIIEFLFVCSRRSIAFVAMEEGRGLITLSLLDSIYALVHAEAPEKHVSSRA